LLSLLANGDVDGHDHRVFVDRVLCHHQVHFFPSRGLALVVDHEVLDPFLGCRAANCLYPVLLLLQLLLPFLVAPLDEDHVLFLSDLDYRVHGHG
jgi:hypothetical protein